MSPDQAPPNVVAIVQARTGSTRLPGKVLAELAGEPMLARVLRRLARATTVDMVVVATTDLPEDDVLAELCRVRCWPCFRGSGPDVLDRYHQAARAFAADLVVRITADCPFIDPEVVDRVVTAFLTAEPPPDYAANVLPPRSYPRGLDTEVLSTGALSRAWRADADPATREHVTQYIVRHPEDFTLLPVVHDEDLSALRWTVDTPEDLAFARRVYDHFGDDDFGWRDLLALLAQHPDWADVNRHVAQKPV